MKRIAAFLLALMLLSGAACAEIIPASGYDEDFYAFTGIFATPAVQLSQNLSVCDGINGKRLQTRRYGDGTATMPVITIQDDWAQIYLEDGESTGWVRAMYLTLDPAWYVADGNTPVYAYDSTSAPRVGLLDGGTKLPIILDNGNWLLVSLRSAAGWVRKSNADRDSETRFRPAMMRLAYNAFLQTPLGGVTVNDHGKLDKMADLLVKAEYLGDYVATCPFNSSMIVNLSNGFSYTIQLATDSSCIMRVDGRDYDYSRSMNGMKIPDNGALFAIFGVDQNGYSLY